MAYWGGIARRAWRETRGEVRWDTPVRVIAALGSPLVAGGVTWIATHQFAWGAASSGAILILLALGVFLLKMVAVPAAIHLEQAKAISDAQSRRTEGQRRDDLIGKLSHLYVNDVEPTPRDVQYGLALPPVDWLNGKLAELGEAWSILDTHGASYTTIDVMPFDR